MLKKTRRIPMLAVVVLGAMTGCTATVLEVGGAKFSLSSSEADVARRYEEAAPLTGATARCGYWNAKAEEIAAGKHDASALGGMVRMNGVANSEGLVAWAQARKSDACAAWEAAAPQREAQLAEARQQQEAQLAEARRQARADAVATAEKRRAAAQAEIDSNRCSDAHHANLETALATLKPLLEGSSGQDTWVLAAQDYVVATDGGQSLSFSTRMRGDYQVLLLGTGAAALEVHDDQGYPASRRSDRAAATLEALAAGFARDTRAVQANAGAKLQITVKGAGCALVAIFGVY